MAFEDLVGYPSQKPPVGAQIDWGNPLSARLVGCWLLNEHGGKQLTNLARPATLNFGGSTVWGLQPSGGTGIKCVNAGDRADLTTPANMKITFPITLVLGMTQIGTGSAFCVLFGVSNSNADVAPYIAYAVSNNTSNNWHIEGNVGGTYADAYTTVAIANGYHFVVAVFGLGSDLKLYVDNVDLTLNNTFPSLTTSDPSYSSTSLITFGAISAVNRNPNSHFHFGYIFNRRMALQEINYLYRNPYGFLTPAATRRRFFGANQAAVLTPDLLLPAWLELPRSAEV